MEQKRTLKLENVSRSGQTIMIGALAAFEEGFGHLWGHGKETSALTDDQLYWLDIWQEVRTKVLDLGNDEIFNLKKYVYKFMREG